MSRKEKAAQAVAEERYVALNDARRNLADCITIMRQEGAWNSFARTKATKEYPNLRATYELAFDDYEEACKELSSVRRVG